MQGRKWVAVEGMRGRTGEGGGFLGGEEEAAAFCAWWCGAGWKNLAGGVEGVEEGWDGGVLAGEVDVSRDLS